MSIADNKKFESFNSITIPVMVLDTNFNIIFKNRMAKETIIKMPVGKNIKNLISDFFIQKMLAAVREKKVINLKIDTQSIYGNCIMVTDSVENEERIILYFFGSINIDNFEMSNRYLYKILLRYNDEKMLMNTDSNEKMNQLKQQQNNIIDNTYLNVVKSNIKKVLRLEKHINFLAKNYQELNNESSYADILQLFDELKQVLPKYLNPLGYIFNYEAPDDMYIQKINRREYISLVLTIITMILNLSMNRQIDIRLSIDPKTNNCIVKFNVKVSDETIKFFKENYFKELKFNSRDISYLDFHYINAIAVKNNSDMEFLLDEKSNDFTLSLIIVSKPADQDLELKSNIIYSGIFDLDYIFEIEFSVLGDNDNMR